jgi:hypothetical protein
MKILCQKNRSSDWGLKLGPPDCGAGTTWLLILLHESYRPPCSRSTGLCLGQIMYIENYSVNYTSSCFIKRYQMDDEIELFTSPLGFRRSRSHISACKAVSTKSCSPETKLLLAEKILLVAAASGFPYHTSVCFKTKYISIQNWSGPVVSFWNWWLDQRIDGNVA